VTPVTVPFPIRHELVPLCQHLAQRFIGSVNPVATSNDARAIAQLDQPIWMIDAVQIVQTQSNRVVVITGERSTPASLPPFLKSTTVNCPSFIFRVAGMSQERS
jgi:hypothetical protein